MKTNQPTPLLLFFASRQIGGGEAYFINLGLEALKAGRRCIVVDYVGGHVISRIPGAEHVEYSDDFGAGFLQQCEAFIPIGAVVFLGEKLRLSPTSKILFVSIHHNHCIELGNWAWLLRHLKPRTVGWLWPMLEPMRRRSVLRFFAEISRRRGLVYCAPFQRDFDEAYLRQTIHGEVVAIPVRERNVNMPAGTAEGKAVVWVSRLAKEKAEIVYELILELKTSKCMRKIIVIGDGPLLRDVRERAAEAGVEIETPGVISSDELDTYLQQNAILCVGVGTSSVEMAMAGLPTLVARLPGHSDGPYVWFHHMRPGDTVVTTGSKGRAISLSEALALLDDKEQRAQISDRCKDAAKNRHAPDAAWRALSDALANTDLCAADATSLSQMSQQPFRLIRQLKLKIRMICSRFIV
jgi:hypothetical protein